jgi:hypothetical protein
MNIKIHIIYLAILLLGLANHTQAQTNLIVKNKSGDATYFELSKIQRITFPNQSLVITNNSTSETTFPSATSVPCFSEIQLMYSPKNRTTKIS